jgi:DNA-binding NtrC family response regulator
MPALREIPEDIPLLANYFLDKYCQEMKKEPKKPTPGALRCLMNYPWPGNVRELENEMKRLAVLTPRRIITEEDLPEAIRERGNNKILTRLMSTRRLKDRVEEFEKQIILEVLETCRQNQKQTAKLLGLSRQGLINRMKRYGIKSNYESRIGS